MAQTPGACFVNSMSDLFHPHVGYAFIADVFDVMREADQHVFQVLTKRPGRAAGWWEKHGQGRFDEWPANVWMGTSVERPEVRAPAVRAATYSR